MYREYPLLQSEGPVPPITFRSDIGVTEVGFWGSDEEIAIAAWASSGKGVANPSAKKLRGVLNALMKDRHGSPFDNGFLCVHIEAPRAVRDEWVRHRNLSYSSSSLRYTLSDSTFYIPSSDRPMRKAEGFRQIQPIYETYTPDEYQTYRAILEQAYTASHMARVALTDAGFVETEAQRWVTTDADYVSFQVRGMLRPWLQYLALRTHNPTANHVSFPMYEIDLASQQVEAIIAERFPVTYEVWNAHGRDI